MVKMLTFVKRRAGLDRQEFLDYWRDEHTALTKQLPGLRRSCNNVSVTIGAREPRIDLVAEAWFDDPEQLVAAYASPAGQALGESLARVADPEQTQSVMVSERVIIPPPTSGSFLKNFATVYRRPDLSLEDFDRHWRENHPKVVNHLPGLRGYVQCPAVRLPGQTPQLDGCAMVWFDDLESLRAASHGSQMPVVRADERLFIVQERMVSVLTAPEP